MKVFELQKQGIYKDVNPEITPEELFKLLKGGWNAEL